MRAHRLHLALLAILAIGCGGGRERLAAVISPDVQEGEGSFRRACAPCHGDGGRGDGPVAPALTTKPSDLTTLAARHGGTYPRDLVLATITGTNRVPAHGSREMPVWSVRFDEAPDSGATAAAALWARRRIELLADYVASLQRPPEP